MSARVPLRRRGLPPSAGVAVQADRRFRRPDVRPGKRRRAGGLVWRIARIGIVGAAVLLLGGWLVSTIVGSRVLAVSHVSVRGNTRLTSGEVEALVDGIRGQSLLLVDLNRYRKRLMDSPWVADVTLWRVLPSTVEVRVVERVPMAVARQGQQLYLIDRAGTIVDEFGPQYKEFDLPIVDGLITSTSTTGTPVDRTRLALTARFFDALQSRPDLRQRVSQVDVSDAHDLVVLLDSDEAFLHLGEDRFIERIRTFFELSPTLHDRFQNVDYVDLRFDERVYIRSRGQAATAIGTGKKK
jgi:cell division protein FtsQ